MPRCGSRLAFERALVGLPLLHVAFQWADRAESGVRQGIGGDAGAPSADAMHDDFPVLLETWRTCLRDEFDLESLRLVLAELESGTINWSETRTSYPSPMAQSIS